ncbi:succinyl-diaminopimelate desuccinylase [Sulfuricurvum kujiense DSM 16994]|uniref:Succinyl-diaminopimelate desuccinylase n=1 Tax=Sulfuricurvum kujiense (strain ATCC BAA-921 / DSM 16994 / JCM 11577 / YK-1) TaxID=709032 RepID=E4U1H0_SULKY|nr:succinyl-diaminopimelate desuccinylase [Sulfuricurvum kujiense]ADR33406.1 succinyl-diaminopimelate desuccinylase [Sulfuricurvum kujiense DSM 16994]
MNVIELFKKLLESPSVTPEDGGIFEFLEEYLEGFTTIRIDREGVKNLFAYRTFGEGKHLCFAGHVDVVPAGEGWESDPFIATEKDGYIYARGAQDMKSGVAAFVQALKETDTFEGTLSVLLTSDEEGPAKFGTVEVLAYLKEHNLLPDAVIVAEPTCEVQFGDAIKVGRRGSINGIIEMIGKQGHAAYPEKAINPVHQIASVLSKIAGAFLDNGDEYFAPSQIVITDIRAGIETTNVSPGKLKMMFNVRNSTRTDQEKIKSFIAEQMGELEYTLALDQSAYPFVTDADTEIVRTLSNAIADVCGRVPKNSTAGGTSDARFIAAYEIDVIEFGVINDTIHAPNERTSIAEVENLYAVFTKLINNFR